MKLWEKDLSRNRDIQKDNIYKNKIPFLIVIEKRNLIFAIQVMNSIAQESFRRCNQEAVAMQYHK